ncbi:NAD(P)/FAD-dependent oxidoreductase [Ectothiorhodospira variabilis]|uniref:geranylgeranyl reductase family protein n=1 Tax=Ectothiorhodospira variabilis TaxID=505694 RepID=UPI001EFABBB1|nr:NAD(P)/FAD-dependent oxidoreductase [Ectothiorhodospira variabilis]MCG5493258.1 NAD(P)/FAD-dependent oxidoreductase [Ectothiorhodospira variabilis]MCG5502587.1 NAD(P)/FAD-dependent oxidoreductase [Ectothiorhodospira variabilis]MCG5505647.1 NAD(P)/FAD-dependent oxidoreductase [Ectothiorhodospira variabilis]
MPSVDVLVVGLGPAGGSAARVAAAEGLSVLGIDRRAVIGQPVQCAEFIPLPMGSYARDPGVFSQPIRHMTTLLPSGASQASDFPGIMIDRAAFDQAIAARAQAQGATLWTDAMLLELDLEARRARVRHAGQEQTITFRALVAADGPHSPVAAQLGWPALEIVQTRQYTVPLTQPRDDTVIWLSPDYPGGYAWLFPREGQANLGLGMDKTLAPDLKTPLDALHRELVEAGWVGEAILSRTGGAIPVGGLRPRVFEGAVVFAGDAAGLTHPITGGGIAPAVVSGELAGEAVAAWLGGDEAALADYQEDLCDRYGPSLERAVARRRELGRVWHRPEAREDAVHRRGWIAFGEYFNDPIAQ